MRALKEAARVTEAAVVQSQSQRYAAEVTIPDLKQRIRETENALSIVLGVPPASISRGLLENQTTNETMQTGVPAQLLANRPDVQQAELAYRSSFELTNVARASFYPTLAITGSAGFSSLTLANFLDPTSIAASIGAGAYAADIQSKAQQNKFSSSTSAATSCFIRFSKHTFNCRAGSFKCFIVI